MNGTYWDDWILRQFVLDGDFAGHFTLWKELGLPGFAYIHWWIGHFGPSPEVAHNFIACTSLLAIAGLVFAIARTMHCSSYAASIMGITAGVYPALETTFVFNVSVYLLMLALFLAGTAVALRLHHLQGGRHIGARIIAQILFIISFQHHSLLVLYGGCLILLLIQRWNADVPLLSLAIQFVKRHADFILLPVIFWVVDTAAVPRVEYYNDLIFDPGIWRTATLGMISKGLMEQLREIVRTLSAHPWIWIVAVLCAVVAGARGTYAEKSANVDRKKAWGIFLYGTVLLALAMLPYILVDKAPRAHGYTTRHGMLLAIPIGILIAGSVQMIGCRNRWQRLAVWLVLTSAYIGSVLALWTNYAVWEARSAKDTALIAYFMDHPELQNIGTFVIEDGMPITTESYRYYEWGAMMRRAWGKPGHLGMSPGESFAEISKIGVYHPHWMAWNHLAGYPLSPCTAQLHIAKTTKMNNRQIGWQYFLHRIKFDEKQMAEFLQSLTQIDVKRDPKTCT
jgi:hypothetical protein